MKTILSKIPILLLVVASLVSGVLTGWYRLGFDLPVSKVFLHHGAIMTGSFLGSVILIERIVALKRKWLFAFPVVNGSSMLFYYLEFQQWAFVCLVVGAAGLVYVFYLINHTHSDLAHRVMWIGSAAWLIGNIHLFLFDNYGHSILWWMAFLLLTIAGERLELSRFLPVSSFQKHILILFLGLFTLSCMVPFHFGGQLLTGISLLLSSLWLLKFDMVRKSIRMPGVHRYTAVTLLFGYIWLAISGALYLLNFTGHVTYDALIHSFFLGFVFSMIFAHAPIILPGVIGVSVRPFHRSLYFWMGLFQVSLLVRLAGGLLSLGDLKQWGGVVNGAVIFLFMLNLAIVLKLEMGGRLKKQLSGR